VIFEMLCSRYHFSNVNGCKLKYLEVFHKVLEYLVVYDTGIAASNG